MRKVEMTTGQAALNTTIRQAMTWCFAVGVIGGALEWKLGAALAFIMLLFTLSRTWAYRRWTNQGRLAWGPPSTGYLPSEFTQRQVEAVRTLIWTTGTGFCPKCVSTDKMERAKMLEGQMPTCGSCLWQPVQPGTERQLADEAVALMVQGAHRDKVAAAMRAGKKAGISDNPTTC